MIVLCAQLCGIEDWIGIEDFAHENWLRRFLELSNRIPSHDTFSDVASLPDTSETLEVALI